MDRLLKVLGVARAIAAIAALGILALAGWDLHLGLEQLRDNLTQLRTTGTYLNQILPIVGGAATNIEKTLREERDASRDQLSQSTAVLKNVNAAVSQAKEDLVEFHALLAGLGKTNSTLDAAIATQSREAVDTEKQAQASLADLRSALQQANAVLADLDHVAANPDLPSITKHLDDAIVEANSVLKHVAGAAASGERDMLMIETKLRQALKPASLAKTIFERALGIAGPAAQIAAAAK